MNALSPDQGPAQDRQTRLPMDSTATQALRCCLAMWEKYQEVIGDMETATASPTAAHIKITPKTNRIGFHWDEFSPAAIASASRSSLTHI